MKKLFIFIGLSFILLIAFIPKHHRSSQQSMKELKLNYPELPEIQSGEVLLIYAHSDDELGTIAQAAKLKREIPSLKFNWIIVSDGGRGFLYPGTCPGMTKQDCRLSEAKKVAECAGLPHPRSLNLPDGNVARENLAELLKEKIPELSSTDLRMVFTHDNRGLYGHSDHVAVYDAVSENLKGRQIPIVAMALPQYIKDQLFMISPGKDRPALPISHVLKLDPDSMRLKICASGAHESQKLILNLLMFRGLDAEDFFSAAPFEFLNSSIVL